VAQVAGATRRFLIGGQRWNIDLPDGWRVDAPDWEDALRALVGQSGRLEGAQAIDYFVFPRGLYPRMPPFAIGRTAWDNWLLLDAWRRGAAVVDATAAITAIHFNHDYGHAGGKDRAFNGPEAVRNRELCDFIFRDSVFSLVHASHVLREGGLKKMRRMIGQRLDLLGFRHPVLGPALRALRDAAKPFRAARKR